VANPLPTWGGDEAESVSEAERRIPRFLQHRDRLVTKDDFATIVWRTPGVDLGRVEILPLFHPEIQDVLSEGVVTVMVIPRYDVAQPETPMPDRLFLDTVCIYLDPRRMVTTEVHVRGPVYKSIWLSVGIDVVPGYDLAPVREAVKASLRQHLSPLFGGYDGQGWPLEKAVEALELWAVATRVEGVAKVNGVQLGAESGPATDRIALTGLQLPRLESLSVQSGEAELLADLRGDEQPPADGQDPARVVPVPVVPPECD
jgi:predicted phage baseplate assembly protein